MGKKKEPTPWEIAKPLLEKDCLDGTVTDDMKPKAVHELKPQHKAVKHERFRDNFNRMKKAVVELRDRAEDDAIALLHDRSLCHAAEGQWDGSEAQRLLKEAVDRDEHKRMAPKQLWLSDNEHQKFPLSIFRPHIHQEA